MKPAKNLAALAMLSLWAASARADVTRVEIAKRADVQGSGYEKRSIWRCRTHDGGPFSKVLAKFSHILQMTD